MIAVVGLARERRESHRQEGLYLDACLAHLFEEPVAHAPTAHIVVDDTHLDTLACLRHQRIGNEPTQGVVLEDVHVDMDVVAGMGNITQQRREELIAAGQQFHLIIIEGQREALVDEEVDDGLIFPGQLQVLLFNESEHGALGQLVERATPHHAFTSCVHAEEQIGNHANDGNKKDDQSPCHRLYGLAVVHDNVDDHPDGNQLIENKDQIEPGHGDCEL